MAIKIKHKDPKPTDFGPNDIVINVKEGTLFYKSEKNIFKLTGDNLDKTNDFINLDSNISASKGYFSTPGIGELVVGSKGIDVFEVGIKTLVVGGSIIPSSSRASRHDLGSLKEPWKDIYLTSDSLHFVKEGKGIGFSQLENGFIVENYSAQSIEESKTISLTHDSQSHHFKMGDAGLLVEGHITASEGHTISSSTGSFDHIITAGETIEFINQTTKAVEGFVKFNTSEGLTVQDSDNNPTKLKGKSLEVESAVFTNITASVISCSGTIIADAFQSAGEDDQLDFSDHINITGNVTASGNIKANGYTGTTGENLALTSGRVLKITHAEGYDVEIGGTNDDDVLKVEGNASTQKVTFGSTTHGLIINSNITSSGNISSSGGNIIANFPDTNDNADHYVIVTTGTDATLEVQNSLSVNPSTNTVTMGNLISDKRQISIPASATDGLTGNGADVIYFGSTTSMTTGAIYHFKSDGTWELADADAASTSDGLLGVALGATSDTDGVLLKGMVNLDHDPGTVGDVLYLSTTAGDCSATAPSGNGDIVRIIGYCLHATTGRIWFDPDKTFVEVNA